jgi:hypothetical protein
MQIHLGAKEICCAEIFVMLGIPNIMRRFTPYFS